MYDNNNEILTLVGMDSDTGIVAGVAMLSDDQQYQVVEFARDDDKDLDDYEDDEDEDFEDEDNDHDEDDKDYDDDDEDEDFDDEDED